MQKFVSHNFNNKRYKKKRKYRKISQKLFSKLLSSKQKSYKIVRIFFLSIISLSILWFFSLLIFEKIVFSYEKYFHRISFDSISTQKYNDKYLYAKLKENLIWMHNWSFKFWEKYTLLSKIQDKYVFVNDITLSEFDNWYAHFDIDIQDPMFIIQSNENKRAIYPDNFYKLNSGDQLWSEQSILYLAQYLSWIDTLSGLFFSISEQNIYNDLLELNSTITDIQKVVYLAWWEKMIVVLPEWKKVIFNNNNPIKPQIDKYLLISQDKFAHLIWIDFAKIRQVDMWSLQYPIVSFR